MMEAATKYVRELETMRVSYQNNIIGAKEGEAIGSIKPAFYIF